MTSRSAKARLAALMGAMLIDMMGFLMLVPLLPIYAVRFGADATLIGIMVGAQPFTAVVTAPYWGRFSDRFGRRPAILLGLAFSGIAYLLFGLAHSITLLMVSRLVQGVGTGTVGVIQAYVTDTVGPNERTKALGWITVATNVGVLIGPVLGSLASHLGEAAPGFLAAGMALVNVAFGLKLLPEPAVPRGPRVPRPLREAATAVLRHPLQPAHRMIWIYSAAMMAFMAMNGVLVLFLQDRFHVTAKNVGYFYTYVAVFSIIMRGGVLGRLVDAIGEIRVLRIGTVCLCVGMALIPLSRTIPVFGIVVALVPIGTSLLFPATSSQVSKHAPPGHVGEFMGLQQAFGGVARMLGPTWGGFVFQHMGVPWPFWGGAALMGLAGFLAVGARIREEAEAAEHAPPPVADAGGNGEAAQPVVPGGASPATVDTRRTV